MFQTYVHAQFLGTIQTFSVSHFSGCFWMVSVSDGLVGPVSDGSVRSIDRDTWVGREP